MGHLWWHLDPVVICANSAHELCMMQDLEHVDPEYHKSLMYILEHDVEEVCPDTAFVTEVDFFGRKDVVELKPGGSSIMVQPALTIE
jgi:hypothetical protein